MPDVGVQGSNGFHISSWYRFFAVGSSVQVQLHQEGLRSFYKSDLCSSFEVIPGELEELEVILDKGTNRIRYI
jgi:hypothetical protein